MKEFKQFDVVALTEDIADEKLFAGQVGTVVEVYNVGEAYEVDFVDTNGHSYGLTTLKPEQLMLLRYEPAEIAA